MILQVLQLGDSKQDSSLSSCPATLCKKIHVLWHTTNSCKQNETNAGTYSCRPWKLLISSLHLHRHATSCTMQNLPANSEIVHLRRGYNNWPKLCYLDLASSVKHEHAPSVRRIHFIKLMNLFGLEWTVHFLHTHDRVPSSQHNIRPNGQCD